MEDSEGPNREEEPIDDDPIDDDPTKVEDEPDSSGDDNNDEESGSFIDTADPDPEMLDPIGLILPDAFEENYDEDTAEELSTFDIMEWANR